VIDINDPECVEQIPVIMARLAEKKIILRERWPGLPGEKEESTGEDDPFRLDLPTLLIANKCDLDPDSGEVEILEELLGLQFPALTVSAKTGKGLQELGPFLFSCSARSRSCGYTQNHRVSPPTRINPSRFATAIR